MQENASLTIWAQSTGDGMGKLIARASSDNRAGIAAKAVWIDDSCRSIGAGAFRNSANPCRVSIPIDCEFGKSAFDGCEAIYIFGRKGSAAERYCSAHDNCFFLEEER